MDHIFHVGYHKTGSTWLQRHVFPTVEGATSLVNDRISAALVSQLVKEDHFYAAAFRSVLDTNGRALVSDERLVGMPWGPSDPDRIADRLLAVSPEAGVVIFTREVDSLGKSLYAQYVNEGGHLPLSRLGEIVNPAYLDVERTIARFRARFANVLVLRYEDLLADPGRVVTELGEFADIRLSIPEAMKWENVSLSGWELEALRRWNAYFRKSFHNPEPLFPLPRARAMRWILQRRASRRR